MDLPVIIDSDSDLMAEGTPSKPLQTARKQPASELSPSDPPRTSKPAKQRTMTMNPSPIPPLSEELSPSRHTTASPFPSGGAAVSSFPYFPDGNVLIVFDVKSKALIPPFRLHSQQLWVNSIFFSDIIESTSDLDEDSPLVFSVQKLEGGYTLVYDPDNELTSTVKEEPDDASIQDDPTSTTTRPQPHHTDPIIQLYKHIFALFYNTPITILSKNISQELRHIETLLRSCQQIRCVHLLTSYINAVIVKYRQNIYASIKADPARWMRLAFALENSAIFTECLIHIAGAWPQWPWPTRKHLMDPSVLRIAAAKAKGLQRLILDVNEEILLATICVGAGKEPVRCTAGDMPTWFVVQLFRDTVCQALWEMKKSNKASMERGLMYRKLHKGGDIYLSFETARIKCLQIQPKGEWKELGSDLTALKSYVSQVVAPLAANRLMIDPDAHGIGYLTCINVEPADIPWEREESEEVVR